MTWPTWRRWRGGRPSRARTSSWSTRCTRPSRSRPIEPSPYLPTTRRFANPAYLRVEDTDEYAAAPAAVRAQVDTIGIAARLLNGEDYLDRDTAWETKRSALELLYAATTRPPEFETWRAAQGDGLDRFATWCALAEEHGTAGADWPPDLDAAEPAAVAAYADANADRLTFHCWLQWLLARQLASAPEHGDAGGDVARRRPRPRGRGAPRGRGRLGTAGRAGHGRQRRCATRPVQPGRTELVAAAVAPGPARRARLRAVPRHGARAARGLRRAAHRPRHRPLPAVVDPRRDERGRGCLRALRPRGADRHPGAGGRPRRSSRDRRGPRRRRAGRARLPARARPAGHLHPVVRVGCGRSAARS